MRRRRYGQRNALCHLTRNVALQNTALQNISVTIHPFWVVRTEEPCKKLSTLQLGLTDISGFSGISERKS